VDENGEADRERKREARDENGGSSLRSASLALAIPTLLVAGPLVGLFLGLWVGGALGHSRAGLAVGLLLGCAAAARETIRVIRRIQDQSK